MKHHLTPCPYAKAQSPFAMSITSERSVTKSIRHQRNRHVEPLAKPVARVGKEISLVERVRRQVRVRQDSLHRRVQVANGSGGRTGRLLWRDLQLRRVAGSEPLHVFGVDLAKMSRAVRVGGQGRWSLVVVNARVEKTDGSLPQAVDDSVEPLCQRPVVLHRIEEGQAGPDIGLDHHLSRALADMRADPEGVQHGDTCHEQGLQGNPGVGDFVLGV